MAIITWPGSGLNKPLRIDRRSNTTINPPSARRLTRGLRVPSPCEKRYDSPMTIELSEEPMTALLEYARVPIIFTVDRVLNVTNRDDGPGGFALSERRLEVPYEKDYDAFADEGSRPG